MVATECQHCQVVYVLESFNKLYFIVRTVQKPQASESLVLVSMWSEGKFEIVEHIVAKIEFLDELAFFKKVEVSYLIMTAV